MPDDQYRFRETPDQYPASLGRISPEKRIDRAIEFVKRIGMEIKFAAKVGEVDRSYVENVIAPMPKEPLVEHIGEIDDG